MTTPGVKAISTAEWDRHLFADVHHFARQTPWLHGPMHVYGTCGVVLFAVLLGFGWWSARRADDLARMAAALWTPVGTLAALAFAQLLDMAEPDPGDGSRLPVLAHHQGDFTFPSDHATMAAAIAAGLLLVHRRLGVVATVAALLMAFDGIYTAEYYPHAVLTGLFLGACCVLVGYALLGDLVERLLTRIESTPLRTLVVTAEAEEVRQAVRGR